MRRFVVVLIALIAFPAPAHAAFPGQNGKIAFAVSGDIYTASPDGSGRANLTPGPGGGARPSWSPDGTRIAFVRGIEGEVEVFVMNADGSAQRRLTFMPGYDDYPAWSPDGQRVVFQHGLPPSLYTISANGGQPTQLTFNAGRGGDYKPDWSPDGSKIAFSGDTCLYPQTVDPLCEGIATNIWLVDSGGGGETVVPNTPDGTRPSWSPDGQRLALQDGLSVFTIGADGSGRQRVIGGEGPVWSPDGTKILFASRLDGQLASDLYVVNADGSDVRRLTDTPEAEEDPDWQPLPLGQPTPFKNASKRCKEIPGDYRNHGECVKASH